MDEIQQYSDSETANDGCPQCATFYPRLKPGSICPKCKLCDKTAATHGADSEELKRILARASCDSCGCIPKYFSGGTCVSLGRQDQISTHNTQNESYAPSPNLSPVRQLPQSPVRAGAAQFTATMQAGKAKQAQITHNPSALRPPGLPGVDYRPTPQSPLRAGPTTSIHLPVAIPTQTSMMPPPTTGSVAPARSAMNGSNNAVHINFTLMTEKPGKKAVPFPYILNEHVLGHVNRIIGKECVALATYEELSLRWSNNDVLKDNTEGGTIKEIYRAHSGEGDRSRYLTTPKGKGKANTIEFKFIVVFDVTTFEQRTGFKLSSKLGGSAKASKKKSEATNIPGVTLAMTQVNRPANQTFRLPTTQRLNNQRPSSSTTRLEFVSPAVDILNITGSIYENIPGLFDIPAYLKDRVWTIEDKPMLDEGVMKCVYRASYVDPSTGKEHLYVAKRTRAATERNSNVHENTLSLAHETSYQSLAAYLLDTFKAKLKAIQGDYSGELDALHWTECYLAHEIVTDGGPSTASGISVDEFAICKGDDNQFDIYWTIEKRRNTHTYKFTGTLDFCQREQSRQHAIVNGFTHWTHFETSGAMVIADLQASPARTETKTNGAVGRMFFDASFHTEGLSAELYK
ncbi:hypothetical protein CYLTODRAFT_495388 [Cylindrobasidium torrendii FP15055 ss-10]|uniref:Alpha-type protein kinase domain-containing protein n=1 Tax=Cylindrobasidium torrendii FP15055 ss-10 TaxID=1314674 RepID=A0A0D7AT00_9AGAR|nr:hypothetical protein CYLTODRAFT_495388 [Cylindrobasidium torrendii FP15055 ss-10]